MRNAVIFDLFGTLIPNFAAVEYQRVTDAMAAAVGAPAGDFARAYGVGTWTLRATGRLKTTEDAVRCVCEMCGIATNEGRVAEASRIRIELTQRVLRPLPGVIKLLEALRARGVHCGLVSDCSFEVPLLWPQTTLAPLIDAAIFSCVAGVKKPDPRIYLLACERLGALPQQCLYVGDGSGQELSGAASVGLTPVLVRVPYAETADTERPEIATWQGLAVDSVADVLEMAG